MIEWITAVALPALFGSLLEVGRRLLKANAEAAGQAARADQLENVVVRYQQTVDRADERIDSLLEQNQHLSEKLATLRVEKGAQPTSEKFVPTEDPDPLSQAIQDHLAGIANQEAREIVESEVWAMRESGVSDPEILRKIEKGD